MRKGPFKQQRDRLYDGYQPKKREVRVDRYGRKVYKNPTQDQPMRKFFHHADPNRLKFFLSKTTDVHLRAFLDALESHSNGNKSVMKLAYDAGVTLHELQMLYTDGCRQLMLMEIAAAAPGIGRDIGIDAATRMVNCPRCDGKKEIMERDDEGEKTIPRTCPQCEGIGKVREIGDKHARDKVFDAMGIAPKAPMVAMVQNFGTAREDGLDMNMENLLKRTQAITMGTREDRE